jgi:hypothetical protein
VGDGRQPRDGEGLGTSWGTSTAVGQGGASGTGPKPVRTGGGARSCETVEVGPLTGGPRLQFRAAVKFNLKSNSNQFKLFKL